MKTTFLIFPFLFFLLIFQSNVYTQSLVDIDSMVSADTSKSLFENFVRQEALDLILTTDFKKLVKEKKFGLYQPAHLVYYNQDSVKVTLEASVKARGRSRKEICSIPPIKIKMNEDHLAEQGFQLYKTLKMVAPCKGAKSYEKFILKEYLSYQLLNILTEYSFKTQLVRLHYIDTSGKLKPQTKYAFLIEHEKEMAHRLSAKVVNISKCPPNKLDKEHANLVYLFQLMIGNTDYKVENVHNLRLLYHEGNTTFFPVPYDFDYSGLVYASYAIPHESVPIKSVRQRYYFGACRDLEEMESSIQIFKNKKEELLNYCQQFDLLSAKDKSKVIKYLNAFFELIKSEKKLKTLLSSQC